jgi:hypothetical protein
MQRRKTISRKRKPKLHAATVRALPVVDLAVGLIIRPGTPLLLKAKYIDSRWAAGVEPDRNAFVGVA